MIIFSQITCKANTTNSVATCFVGGIPYSHRDLEGWTCYDNFIKECSAGAKISIAVKTYGYGVDSGFGRFEATAEEVAYITKRFQVSPNFLVNSCEKISQHKISLTVH